MRARQTINMTSINASFITSYHTMGDQMPMELGVMKLLSVAIARHAINMTSINGSFITSYHTQDDQMLMELEMMKLLNVEIISLSVQANIAVLDLTLEQR